MGLLKVGIAVVLFSVGHAPAQTATETAIRAQYDEFARAYVKNDVPAMLATLTSDFRLISGEGKTITRRAYKAVLEKRKAMGSKVDRYTIKIVSFKAKGSGATIESEETSILLDSKGSELQKTVHRYLDNWVKQAGVWRLRLSKTLSDH